MAAHPSRRALRGFTLIELMITVAIVAILASIAYPMYTQSVTKSRRADAKTALLDLAQREERFMSTANTYTTDPVQLGFPAGTTFPINVMSGSKAYYTLTVGNIAGGTIATGFIATAKPIAPQTSDSCGTFTLDSLGRQAASGATPGGDCW